MADKYAHLARGGTSRSCRRSDGYPKRAFPSAERAQEVVVRASAQGKALRAYHCPRCDNWHVATERSADAETELTP